MRDNFINHNAIINCKHEQSSWNLLKSGIIPKVEFCLNVIKISDETFKKIDETITKVIKKDIGLSKNIKNERLRKPNR